MFADKTLTPREAVRLCALGTIVAGPMHYSALASSVRHFISRLTGPSVDLLGTSIELLRYEGLVEAVGGEGMEDDALLAVTDAGRKEFRNLMVAPLRAASDLSKLITALKFRFLHLLDREDQEAQVELLIDTSETGLNRLLDLRDGLSDEGGYVVDWLDDEVSRAEARLNWLHELKRRVQQAG